MDTVELRELLSTDGLRLLDEVGSHSDPGDVVSTVSRLRAAGHSPGLVAAVLSQSRLRTRAETKFGPFAARMLFTEAGLEQATRLRVAAVHAGRFAAAGVTHVADLGCGIGADSLALASLDLRVTAVELDEVTAAVAAFNLVPFPAAEVVQGDATTIDLTRLGVDGVWLDPARRQGGRRLADPADWTPSLDFAFGLGESYPTGVKLGPGIDRDLIPEDAEAQWISVGREVVELVVWRGSVARAGIRRAALVLGDSGADELTADDDSVDAEPGDLGGWLYEPDGAVIRARLIGDLARRVGGRMLDASIAWITADVAAETPFAQRFRVIEEFPLDVKRLRRELSDRGIGRLEIKKRGVDVDPAEFRKRLGLSGDGEATLVLTRRAGRRVAILAERA